MNEKKTYAFRVFGDICTDHIEEGAEPMKSFRKQKIKIKRVFIAAAVLVGSLILILGATAATSYDLGFYISQKFGGEVEMLDAMTAAPQNVRYTATNDGVKFEVVGIIGDAYNAYVLFDMTLPEYLVSEDMETDLFFGRNHIDDVGWIYLNGFSSSLSRFPEKKADNIYSFCARLSTLGCNALIGRRVRITINDIALGSMRTETLISGEWKMSFSLNYTDVSKIYKPDITDMRITVPESDIEYFPDKVKNNSTLEYTAKNCSVSISPISLTLSIDYESADNKAAHSPLYMNIAYNDGTIISYKVDYGSGEYKAGKGKVSMGIRFDELIDPYSVSAIIFGGVTISLR